MPHDSHTQMLLFRLATQYYAAGRFGAIGGLMPVCGNLLHHAIEMYLKGTLAPTHDLKALKKLDHDLRGIWRRAKDVLAEPRLASFDDAIERLQPFERLRYPDAVITEGASMRLVRLRSEWAQFPAQTHHVTPQYDLILEEVDELVKTIFSVAHLNPAFFLQMLNAQVLSALNEDNLHVLHRA